MNKKRNKNRKSTRKMKQNRKKKTQSHRVCCRRAEDNETKRKRIKEARNCVKANSKRTKCTGNSFGRRRRGWRTWREEAEGRGNRNSETIIKRRHMKSGHAKQKRGWKRELRIKVRRI